MKIFSAPRGDRGANPCVPGKGGKQFSWTFMRLACGLAIALGLSFPAAGMAWQQDPAGSANSSEQAPAVPAPAEKAPAENAPAAGRSIGGRVEEKAGCWFGERNHETPPATPPAPDGAPRKIVIREGGASEPAAQIAPDITPVEATQERQGTEQLLGAAGNELKQLAGRTLDARQQETVGQIRNYMDGARSALHEGDVRRASTLAQKAHLLAEDLAKH